MYVLCRCPYVHPELIQPAVYVGWLLAQCSCIGLTWHGKCSAVLFGVFSIAGHLWPSEKRVNRSCLDLRVGQPASLGKCPNASFQSDFWTDKRGDVW